MQEFDESPRSRQSEEALRRELRSARQRIATLEQRTDVEARFRLLVENSPDVIMTVDREGVIRFINHTLPDYRVEDVVGTSAFDYVDAADRERYRRTLSEVFERGEPRSLELSAAGASCWLARIVPLSGDGATNLVLTIASDITERKRAEEKLRESENRFRTLANTTTAAIFIFQGEKMVYANAAAEAITGYSLSELDGMRFWEVIHPDEREAVRDRGLKRQEGQMVERRFEVRLLTKSGEAKWVDYMGSVFELGGKPAVLGTAVDITERKQAEEERRLLETKVQHAQKLESLGVLAGGIAHDFNNLLTGILGSASLAAMKVPPGSAAADQLDRILRSAEKAAELTNQMLAYSGRGQFVMSSLDLNAVVSEVLPLVRSSVPKGAELQISLAENLPQLFADRAQMQQVFVNLVTNAAEALEGGEGVVAVRTGVRTSEGRGETEEDEGPWVFLEVSDTGSGMDEATERRIFDPFFTTKFTGRGLGLAAVQGIVRAHGGSIRVESAPRKGTRVLVLLPAESRDLASAGAVGDAGARSAGGTILVIDDEESVRSVARVSLEDGGFEVLTADDGKSALALFEERAGEIDAVLLDMSMPRLNGEETLEVLRRHRPELPVVLTSGYSEQEIAQRFKKTGVSYFVQKPFRPTELVTRMREALASATSSTEGI